MYGSQARRSFGMIRTLPVLTLLIVAFFATTVPLYAHPGSGPKPDRNPHAIVSSDGFVPPVNNAGVQQGNGGQYSLPHQGTGEGRDSQGPSTSNSPAPPAAVPGEDAGTESIIGADQRYQITATAAFPYSAIVFIESDIGGYCTGWLISPNTVATAGHCVYSEVNNRWITYARVYPGRNGSTMPYPRCNGIRFASVAGWTTNENIEYDYGTIKLDCTVGYSTGWFGLRWQPTSMNGQASYIAGYPSDKPFATMWRSNDSIRVTTTRRLFYANDTYTRQSGAPVWNDIPDCSYCGIAIHTYGVPSDPAGVNNSGTRITEEVFNNLVMWKNS